MTSFDRGLAVMEGGWVLTGKTGKGAEIKLVLGETELSRAYLGMTIGRHPALCDRVIDDPGISHRHVRLGIAEGGLFAEDLNSLNGTLLEDEELEPFQPVPIGPDQVLILGQVALTVSRLTDD
ncbi:MAG: FHA domain-containing protein [Pseudomonadota bacterium]